MFSLRLSERRHEAERTRGVGRGLLGRALGCAAGLVLVAAFDAYALDHALQRHLMRNDWSVMATVQSGVALLRR